MAYRQQNFIPYSFGGWVSKIKMLAPLLSVVKSLHVAPLCMSLTWWKSQGSLKAIVSYMRALNSELHQISKHPLPYTCHSGDYVQHTVWSKGDADIQTTVRNAKKKSKLSSKCPGFNTGYLCKCAAEEVLWACIPFCSKVCLKWHSWLVLGLMNAVCFWSLSLEL